MKKLLLFLCITASLRGMEQKTKTSKKKSSYKQKMYALKKREVVALEKAVELAELEFAVTMSQNHTPNELKALVLAQLKVNQIINTYFSKMGTTNPDLFNEITSRMQAHMKPTAPSGTEENDESEEEGSDNSDNAIYGDSGENATAQP